LVASDLAMMLEKKSSIVTAFALYGTHSFSSYLVSDISR